MHAPHTLTEAMAYRYGQPVLRGGIAYDPTRCAASVRGSSPLRSHQCTRRNGHGPANLYCRIHARKVTP